MFKLSAATLAVAMALVSQVSVADGPTAVFGRDHMKAIDTDKNGTVSKTEFTDFFSNLGGDARDTNSAGRGMEVDKNKKGVTDLVIKQSGHTERHDPLTEEELSSIFAQADANGDGQLIKDELKTAHKAMHDHRAAKMFAKIDTNGDGYISRKEADTNAPMLAENFTSLDTNKDGKLSPDEIKAGYKKMKKSMKSGSKTTS